jgi:hypothetical protein
VRALFDGRIVFLVVLLSGLGAVRTVLGGMVHNSVSEKIGLSVAR